MSGAEAAKVTSTFRSVRRALQAAKQCQIFEACTSTRRLSPGKGRCF